MLHQEKPFPGSLGTASPLKLRSQRAWTASMSRGATSSLEHFTSAFQFRLQCALVYPANTHKYTCYDSCFAYTLRISSAIFEDSPKVGDAHRLRRCIHSFLTSATTSISGFDFSF